jgi:hypothetical protein
MPGENKQRSCGPFHFRHSFQCGNTRTIRFQSRATNEPCQVLPWLMEGATFQAGAACKAAIFTGGFTWNGAILSYVVKRPPQPSHSRRRRISRRPRSDRTTHVEAPQLGQST